MPPQRSRYLTDDARLEPLNSKERSGTSNPGPSSKNRRNGQAIGGPSLRDPPNNVSQSMAGNQQGQEELSKIDWSTSDTATLRRYRHVHQLDAPATFLDSYNQRLLSKPGIGRLSPTMARRKGRRRVEKEVLAAAVKKSYNAAAVHEQDIITKFIYGVNNQDKHFKMRFEPRTSGQT